MLVTADIRNDTHLYVDLSLHMWEKEGRENGVYSLSKHETLELIGRLSTQLQAMENQPKTCDFGYTH